MPELLEAGLAWKADCLDDPSSNFKEREEEPSSPIDSPKLSFDMPTSSSTLIGLFECTAVGFRTSCVSVFEGSALHPDQNGKEHGKNGER
jgi:hypothetical protein